MDQFEVDQVRQAKQDTPTDKLVELYKKRSSWYSAEFFEAVRQMLVERGVSDASLDLSPPQVELASQAPQASSRHAGFAIVGCLAGGLVGDLVGASLARELALNFTLAGAIAGIVAGLGLASLMSNQGTRQPVLEAETICPQCGTPVPNGMQFCGKCGKAIAAIVCRQCGKAVPPDQQFCGSCGTRVESA
jgi:rRNA maturation endonuclease Nob1